MTVFHFTIRSYRYVEIYTDTRIAMVPSPVDGL